ncbi:unnamed protein product [Peronospora belbahrii]|uniref:Reverse transcriptase Ty1/copia-type domain-containing protein n=1 Tax=Peronospora belbahrii TaxID=622444 RepID=A0ABN8D988_9STRA|nr:unnamed protein product [Peronospora belbahrii]
MKLLGEVRFILGMEIDHDKNVKTLMIKQTRYIDDVVKRFNEQNATSVEYPCAFDIKLSKLLFPATKEERAKMKSRPCHAFLRTLERNIGKRIFAFFDTWSRREHGIMYHGGSRTVTAEAFTEADWERNRRSKFCGSRVHGFKLLYARGALGARHAERHGSRASEGSAFVWEDNQGAIALACNAGYHARKKKVEICHQFIRKNVERETLKVDYVDTKNQLANILSTGLGTKTFKFLRDASGIKSKVSKQ